MSKSLEYILNDCLNKAMCQKGRIQQPNSNNIADFVYRYLQDEKLTLDTATTKHSEQLVFLIKEFQTPKGNRLIDLLMERDERNKIDVIVNNC